MQIAKKQSDYPYTGEFDTLCLAWRNSTAVFVGAGSRPGSSQHRARTQGPLQELAIAATMVRLERLARVSARLRSALPLRGEDTPGAVTCWGIESGCICAALARGAENVLPTATELPALCAGAIRFSVCSYGSQSDLAHAGRLGRVLAWRFGTLACDEALKGVILTDGAVQLCSSGVKLGPDVNKHTTNRRLRSAGLLRPSDFAAPLPPVFLERGMLGPELVPAGAQKLCELMARPDCMAGRLQHPHTRSRSAPSGRPCSPSFTACAPNPNAEAMKGI